MARRLNARSLALALALAVALNGLSVSLGLAGEQHPQLPILASLPSSGALAPVTTDLEVQLDSAAEGWRADRKQFDKGHFGLRLSDGASVAWFIPGGESDREALPGNSIVVKDTISFDPVTAIVSAQTGGLSPGKHYTATLAIKDAFHQLLDQDLERVAPSEPPEATQLFTWSFQTAVAATASSVTTSITGSGGSTPTVALSGGIGVTTAAAGAGALATAAYVADPTGAGKFSPSSGYFDLAVALGSHFTTLTSSVCGLTGGGALQWWTGTNWQPVAPQSWSGGCAAMTLTATSSPSLAQLGGTVFAAVPAPSISGLTPSAGSSNGGDTVTIQGSGFSGATAVAFGAGAVASGNFSVVSDSEIQVVSSPPGTGSVDVSVTTPGGTSAASSADQYLYVAPAQNLLANGDFSSGIKGWTLLCNGTPGQPGSSSPCGNFALTAPQGAPGLTLDSSASTAKYIGAEQIVAAGADTILSGTVTVSQMTECNSDASVLVTVFLLDAKQQTLGTADQFTGNITAGHHPSTNGCTPYVPGNSATQFYQDMPNWSAGSGTQRFVVPLGSIAARQLSGIDASQVAYLRVRLQIFASGSHPIATFGALTLRREPVVNVKAAGARGDGTTNDTAAFKKALDQLDLAGGGTLQVPAATYLVDPDSVVVHSRIVVDGPGATLMPTRPGFEMLGISGSEVALEGLTLDGTGLAVRGLSLEPGSANTLLSQLTVRNLAQPTNPTDPNYYGMPVGIKINGNIVGVQIDTTTVHNVVADHPECASGCARRVARGILISPAPGQPVAQNVTVEYSSLSEVGPKDDGDCLVIQDSSDSAHLLVQRNTFDRCHKRAVKIQVPGALVTNNVITNSFLNDNFTDPVYGYAQSQFAFDMYSAVSVYASNVTVSDNTISGSGSFYVGIELGAGYTLDQITVLGNSVQMGSSSTTYGSFLVREMSIVTNLTITTNTLTHGWTGVGYVVGSDITGIHDNTITDVTYPMLATQAVQPV